MTTEVALAASRQTSKRHTACSDTTFELTESYGETDASLAGFGAGDIWSLGFSLRRFGGQTWSKVDSGRIRTQTGRDVDGPVGRR